MMDTKNYTVYKAWKDVLAAAQQGSTLYYWAPMDPKPRKVVYEARARTLRIFPGGDCDPFTADAGHLPRFYREFGGAQ